MDSVSSAGVLPVPDDSEHTPDLLFWSGTESVRTEAALESKTENKKQRHDVKVRSTVR